MEDGNSVFLWLVLALLGYGWIRFLLLKIFKKPIFWKLDKAIEFADKVFPTGLVRMFFDIFYWTH